MLHRLVSVWTFVCLGILALAGCGDGTGPGKDDPLVDPVLSVVAGAPASDTVFARLAQPVVVEVRDRNGRARAGVEVRFAVQPLETEAGTRYLAVVARRAIGPLQGAAVIDTTDAQGRASAYLGFGPFVGEGELLISLPGREVQTSASYTVLPGAPVKLLAVPRDTAVYVGRSYTLRAALVDRFGNPHPDPVTFGPASSRVTLSPAGVVTGAEIGRASVRVQAMNWTDSVHVSVVPVGTLAARAAGRMIGDSMGLAVVNLDGSEFRRVVPQGIQGSEVNLSPAGAPRWDPSGTRFVYDASSEGTRRLFVSDLAGNVRRLIQTPYAALSESEPVFSPDGAWIYYVGGIEEYRAALWRVRADGTAPERLASPEGDHRDFLSLSVSPDGSRLVYLGRDWLSEHPRMYVREIATGARTQIAEIAASPKWSPGGDLIAYLGTLPYGGYSGPLRVIRPDGTGDRIVTSGIYHAGLDWSPDGRYLVAYRSATVHTPEIMRLELVDLLSGERIPLPFAGRLFAPAWRP